MWQLLVPSSQLVGSVCSLPSHPAGFGCFPISLCAGRPGSRGVPRIEGWRLKSTFMQLDPQLALASRRREGAHWERAGGQQGHVLHSQ